MARNDYGVIIIGGGASGLACAAELIKNETKQNILVIDAGERFGKKLSASGNGQGNIANADMSVKHYHGGNLPLVEKIACNDPYDGAKLVNCLFGADDR